MTKYNTTIIAISILYLMSCNKEQTTNHQFFVNNSSSHKVEIPIFDGLGRTSLLPNNSYNVIFNERGLNSKLQDFVIYFNSDSVKLIYNDTLTISHGSVNYNIAKDIRKINSYSYESLGDDHKYSYNFTNEDFREADSIVN
ncbi:MAG: hypothetical protein ABF242_06800 [Flavobacteriales bacterium]